MRRRRCDRKTHCSYRTTRRSFTRGLTSLLLLAVLAAAGQVFAADSPLFREVAAASGLDFVHHNGMTGQFYFSEMMGPGVALLDYDNDGDLDVYLVQGHTLGKRRTPGEPSSTMRDQLFENQLEVQADGSRRLRFVDVTTQSGLDVTGYGMGVTTGDYDNDGWVDLYITQFGSNQLWRNRGRKAAGQPVTFEDVTAATGANDRRWSVSASFADYDADGWLDLYVANYVNFALPIHKPCRNYTGAPDYCSPLAYSAEGDRLLRNLGGKFERAEAKAGLAEERGAGLGTVAADLDGNGYLDFYVANDQSANLMWLNQGDGTFLNEALLAGTAVNAQGQPEAGMGVASGDVDGDGDVDLLVSHLTRETNTLYINEGAGFFEDRTQSSGMATPSWDSTGFGLVWIDYDNDGWLDLAVANGAVKHLEALVRAKDPFPLHEPNQLFRNLGQGRFTEVTGQGGDAFALSEVSRGLAVGDLDNDGDSDLVVANNNGPARLLLNEVGAAQRWIGLRLISRQGRDALGAQLAVVRRGAATLHRRVQTDGSYASASDARILVGLGNQSDIERLDVVWLGGERETFKPPAVGAYTTLRQGDGAPTPPTANDKAKPTPAEPGTQ